ncbi:MAG: beta-lactam-binding protein with PASTA domain [Cyclobacteriaceae bacterium]|jgi:beta-lactam-binding protein with PASTA domain
MSDTLRNVLNVLKHLAIITAILVSLILGFFYIYLPTITKHGESISVPELEGKELHELEEFLTSKKLRFEVEPDSGYSAKYPALAILRQDPLPNSKVKENRKIYVTLNAKNPPVVKVPDLHGYSKKHAILQLESLGLYFGKATYIPEPYINTVQKYYYQGKQLKENDEVPKGSKIDFILADGLGNRKFPVPNLVGQDYEDAKVALFGMGLNLGNVFFEKEGKIQEEIIDNLGNKEMKEIDVAPGKIFKQKPSTKRDSIRIGEEMDLWVVKIDTVDLFNISDVLEEEKTKED